MPDLKYRFYKNEDELPCFQCQALDDVIGVANAIALAMFINDVEGYVTARDQFGNFVHMVNTDEIPEIYGQQATSALIQEDIRSR
jgi:hypothetical protein